jgi:bacteriocin-like protein
MTQGIFEGAHMSQGEQKPRTNPEQTPPQDDQELTDAELDNVSGGLAEQTNKNAMEERSKQVS